MKISLPLLVLWLSLSQACGNDRQVNNRVRQPPNIDNFTLQADEEGIYGYWQRTDSASDSDSRMYLTIDTKVVGLTTICPTAAKSLRVTAFAKSQVLGNQLVILNNEYFDVVDEASNTRCHAQMRKGTFKWKVTDSGQLEIKEPKFDVMTFERVKKSNLALQ